ncbi:MAG: type II toxin-antitoxin system VapC family toxin [Massilia sp.]
MGCYIDTSALVALCAQEPNSDAVDDWYRKTKVVLYSSVWTVPEFASAISVKKRRGDLTLQQASKAWTSFQLMCARDLRLLKIESRTFHKAAEFVRDPHATLRGGDALHVACTLAARIPLALTLDKKMARSLLGLNIALVQL